MQEKVFRDLVDFIYKQTGSYDVPITKETSLEDDLGRTGDEYFVYVYLTSGKHIDINGIILGAIGLFLFISFFFKDIVGHTQPSGLAISTIRLKKEQKQINLWLSATLIRIE